ncbi:helix-turn-helix domain-containing protein [Luteimonas sp. R10]|uniref:helix-turn-helix domain-containing protein n=1 Tax=Luteimonas sp. R10 TaxID=3108176 RepID=UPI003085D734|nr:helix-turn-helix transcriptional regulator [Luteimonas sp. R10]
MSSQEAEKLYGRRLRQARKSYGFSQPELGVAAGLDYSGAGVTISRYENGRHQARPGLQKRLARVLALPLIYFFTEDDEEAASIAAAARSDEPAKRKADAEALIARMKRL